MSQESNHLKKTPRTEHISNLVISFPNLKKKQYHLRDLSFCAASGEKNDKKKQSLGKIFHLSWVCKECHSCLPSWNKRKKRCRSFLPCTPQHIKLWTHKVWSQKKETWWIHEVPGDPCRMERFFGYRKTSAAQWVAFKHCPSSTPSRLVGERVVLQTAARKTRWYNGKEEKTLWISLART